MLSPSSEGTAIVRNGLRLRRDSQSGYGMTRTLRTIIFSSSGATSACAFVSTSLDVAPNSERRLAMLRWPLGWDAVCALGPPASNNTQSGGGHTACTAAPLLLLRLLRLLCHASVSAMHWRTSGRRRSRLLCKAAVCDTVMALPLCHTFLL